MPSVDRAYREYRDKGLEVVLINFREDPDRVRRTVAERGYGAPVLLDVTGEVAGKGYGVWGAPTVFFVDRRGQLLGRAVGGRGWGRPEARAFLEALLEEGR